jgi:hypothetical protein
VGEPTLAPWPTPIPTEPPHPTRPVVLEQAESDPRTVMRLPGVILSLDMAVHPTEGWPAIATVRWPFPGQDAREVYVSVFNPAGGWGASRSIDVGGSSLGNDAQSGAHIGVTGDRNVHVVYGADDARNGWTIWTRESTDLGQTWSEPRGIAGGCWRPLDMATSAEGWITVLAACGRDRQSVEPVVLVREPGGRWREPVLLPTGHMAYLEGTIAIAGDSKTARAVLLVYSMTHPATIFTAPFALQGGTPRLHTIPLVLSGDKYSTLHRRFSAITFGHGRDDGAAPQAVGVSWVAADTGNAYALTSPDGGESWLPVQRIAAAPSRGDVVLSAPLAYEPVADRLVSFWPCCVDTLFTPAAAEHRVTSGALTGAWSPAAPLISGARMAGLTVAAQRPGGRFAWVAWVEQQQVIARTVVFNQVLPPDVYPAPTIRPTASP